MVEEDDIAINPAPTQRTQLARQDYHAASAQFRLSEEPGSGAPSDDAAATPHS